MHQCDEFGHLRHLHLAGSVETDAAADEHGADDPGHAGQGDAGPEHRRQHCEGHADDAVEIAAARGFRIGEPPETQDEENRGADIGNCSETGGHARDLLFAEHRQHAAGNGESAEHVDCRQRECHDSEPENQCRRTIIPHPDQRRRNLHERTDGDDA